MGIKRLAISSDFDSIHRICMHPTVIPFLSFEPMSADEFAPIFAGLLESQRFFVFEQGGASIGGFAHVSRHPGRSHHTAFISTLAVDPALHSTGFARAMMSNILTDLERDSVRRVELVVEADNPRAIRFYERMGFSIEGTMRGSYRRAQDDIDVDSHIMALLFRRV
ncbi:MAG TPA: GNAT family N-acetyltransferase [Steroidobacteraceae bacterium]|nr:GNAT family N-acetyltransferase [Steroidobacteraceae bacterium]